MHAAQALRAPQQFGRPLVVVVFDSITAQRVAVITGALTPEDAPVPVLEEEAWSTSTAARATVALIRPSSLQRFVRLAESTASLACVEPGLFLLADLLGEIHSLDPHAIRRCKAAFAQICGEGIAARLSMEALFFRPAETALQLGSLLPGPPAGPIEQAADPEGYKAALAALVAAAGRDRAPFFAVGTRYAVSQTGLGRFVLGRGWSHLEEWFTWSDGFTATLVLMLPEASAGPLRVVFRGHVVDERIAITTFVRGVRMATTTIGVLRAVEIDVPLTFEPLASATEVEIRFAFNTVCTPKQLGWSTDGRSLAFALASFEFTVEGRWRAPPLDADGFVRLAGETPLVRRGLDRAQTAQADRQPPPLAVLRRLLDRRPRRVCVVLIEESAIDEPRWSETVQALAAEVLVLAGPSSARVMFARAPGDVLQVEGGLEPVLAILARHDIRPNLLVWSSGASALAFDALWDRLLADGGRPAVLIRKQDFDEFRWIQGSRRSQDFMMGTVGDLILFDPVERMAEL